LTNQVQSKTLTKTKNCGICPAIQVIEMVTEVAFLEVEVDREVEVGLDLEVNRGLGVDLGEEVLLGEEEMEVKVLNRNSMRKMKIHQE